VPVRGEFGPLVRPSGSLVGLLGSRAGSHRLSKGGDFVDGVLLAMGEAVVFSGFLNGARGAQ
jgi:hypothetical protein